MNCPQIKTVRLFLLGFGRVWVPAAAVRSADCNCPSRWRFVAGWAQVRQNGNQAAAVGCAVSNRRIESHFRPPGRGQRCPAACRAGAISGDARRIAARGVPVRLPLQGAPRSGRAIRRARGTCRSRPSRGQRRNATFVLHSQPVDQRWQGRCNANSCALARGSGRSVQAMPTSDVHASMAGSGWPVHSCGLPERRSCRRWRSGRRRTGARHREIDIPAWCAASGMADGCWRPGC